MRRSLYRRARCGHPIDDIVVEGYIRIGIIGLPEIDEVDAEPTLEEKLHQAAARIEIEDEGLDHQRWNEQDREGVARMDGSGVVTAHSEFVALVNDVVRRPANERRRITQQPIEAVDETQRRAIRFDASK